MEAGDGQHPPGNYDAAPPLPWTQGEPTVMIPLGVARDELQSETLVARRNLDHAKAENGAWARQLVLGTERLANERHQASIGAAQEWMTTEAHVAAKAEQELVASRQELAAEMIAADERT